MMTAVLTNKSTTDTFATETSRGPVGMTTPQKMGSRLWLPMFAMSLAGFATAIVLAAVRANQVAGADPADVGSIETLRHLVAGFMFVGFTAVFASVSFAIARILGTFRVGGGHMQDDVGQGVRSLKMPMAGRAFIGLMMMGMMAMSVGVIVHFAVGFGLSSQPLEADLLTSERWFLFSEGIRRLGAGLYLVGITFGLVTIIQVLRYQSSRIRQLARFN